MTAEGLPTPDEIKPVSLELAKIAIGKPEKLEGMAGIYNPAAWKVGGKIYLLGRFIEMTDEELAPGEEPAPATGEEPVIRGGPDVGPLALRVLGPDGKIIPDLTREVWRPKVGEPLLEDPRALLLNDGRLIFGLTAVDQNGTPYPAVLVTSTEKLMEGTPIEPQVIRVLGSGDQTTPVGENVAGKNITAIGPNSFMFRPEGRENHHRFQVFDIAGDVVEHRQYIELPTNITWAKWKMGTCMSPEWTNDREAFSLIHGISIVDGKYAYSIGSARMVKDEDGVLSIDNISQEPLLTSASFDNVVQRHKERDAIYSTGWIPHRDERGSLVQLEVFASPGDERTDRVFLDPREIIKHWERPELAVAA